MRLVKSFEVDNAQSNVKLPLVVREKTEGGKIFTASWGKNSHSLTPALLGIVLYTIALRTLFMIITCR